jgi:HTH-type transcriptional regulator/antitoxin HigA
MDIKPIKNERDYEQALRRVESLWKSPEGSPETNELDVLATLIETYERAHYPIFAPSQKCGAERIGVEVKKCR